MKDWHVKKVAGRKYLIHICPKYRSMGNNQWAYQKGSEYPGTCFRYDAQDRWRCRRCHTEAPEEIAFVAELASCYNVAKRDTNFCWRVEVAVRQEIEQVSK